MMSVLEMRAQNSPIYQNLVTLAKENKTKDIEAFMLWKDFRVLTQLPIA